MSGISYKGRKALRISLMLFCWMSLIFPVSVSFGNVESDINADRQFSFAEKCFTDGEYPSAALEYKKFVFFFPDDQRVESARYKTCLSLYRSGRYREAIESCRSFEDEDTLISQKASWLISRSYLGLGMNGPAVITLNNLIMRTKDTTVQDQARYEPGWIHLEYPSHSEEYSDTIQKARTVFEKISEGGRKEFKIEELSHELKKYPTIATKNPFIAGSLSIVPGAGQLYCKRYQDAVVAFLLNAGLGLAAYESFDDENYALGGLISCVGIGFYAGNIYGAVSSAHKYNRESNQNFINGLKDRIKINVSDWTDEDRISILYQQKF